ncbi:MAG TPA: SCO family protein [Phycisphaerae bacterium]|jgi:cytochrome oxidase Cu insertion factor (SCO1/SenC/PrrC family)
MPSKWFHRIILGALAVAAIAVLGFSIRARLGTEPAETGPPVLWPVQDFTLTDATGRTITRKDLLGKVWVADFIFTSCAGTCPTMTKAMKQVEQDLADVPDLKLVSISVDPGRDTPEVLAGYAKYYHADPQRWLFLTGQEREIRKLIGDSFKLMKEEDLLFHSPRFSIVDRQGRVRGGYDGTEAESLPKLEHDVRVIAHEH